VDSSPGLLWLCWSTVRKAVLGVVGDGVVKVGRPPRALLATCEEGMALSLCAGTRWWLKTEPGI
jgi:hypothetical protein